MSRFLMQIICTRHGKLSDKEFFQKLGDYTVAYSALEFLGIKTLMFEMKKIT